MKSSGIVDNGLRKSSDQGIIIKAHIVLKQQMSKVQRQSNVLKVSQVIELLVLGPSIVNTWGNELCSRSASLVFKYAMLFLK